MYVPDELRLYYNHTIHPELKRLERKRKGLMVFLAASFIVLLVILFLQIYIRIFLLTLVLMIPMVLYIAFIFYEFDKFRHRFKPKIVNLILEFINRSVDFKDLKYIEDGEIDPKTFRKSRLFNSAAPDYVGEDYIEGKIREQEFEMSELAVKEFSPVRNRLDEVFRGVFLHTKLTREVSGEILILPKHQRQYLSATIKAFTVNGSWVIETKNERFKHDFLIFGTPNADKHDFLSNEMQESILKYKNKTRKDMYVSFIGSDVFIAVTQPKDLLEPVLWQSNVSFDLISEFYEDLILLMSIVKEIDANA